MGHVRDVPAAQVTDSIQILGYTFQAAKSRKASESEKNGKSCHQRTLCEVLIPGSLSRKFDSDNIQFRLLSTMDGRFEVLARMTSGLLMLLVELSCKSGSRVLPTFFDSSWPFLGCSLYGVADHCLHLAVLGGTNWATAAGHQTAHWWLARESSHGLDAFLLD